MNQSSNKNESAKNIPLSILEFLTRRSRASKGVVCRTRSISYQEIDNELPYIILVFQKNPEMIHPEHIRKKNNGRHVSNAGETPNSCQRRSLGPARRSGKEEAGEDLVPDSLSRTHG